MRQIHGSQIYVDLMGDTVARNTEKVKINTLIVHTNLLSVDSPPPLPWAQLGINTL